MTTLLALVLSLVPAAHAKAPPGLAGLGTAGGSLVLAVPGAIGGFASWDAKVALAGAGATVGSFALIGAGVAFANGDERGKGALLILSGMTASIVAPPIAMGVVSGHQARVSAPREGLALNEIGYVHVESGGGLRLGGQW